MTFGEIIEQLGFPYIPTEDNPVRRFKRRAWTDGKLCGARHEISDYPVSYLENLKVTNLECISDETLTRADLEATDWEFYDHPQNHSPAL